MRPMKPQTMKEAVQLASGVPVKRAIGHSMIEDGDITGGRFALAEANSMERIAAEYMDIGNHVTGPVRPGNGGELVVPTKEAWASIPGVLCTVQESPDMLSATASRERLELTGNALAMAIDAAASIQAKNSLERMLAHEMRAHIGWGCSLQSRQPVSWNEQGHSTLSGRSISSIPSRRPEWRMRRPA